jgi:hypothetical protein
VCNCSYIFTVNKRTNTYCTYEKSPDETVEHMQISLNELTVCAWGIESYVLGDTLAQLKPNTDGFIETNLTRLSMFDDRQLATRVPGAMFGGLRRTLNSTVTQRDERFILVRALFRVTAFTSSRRVAFCVGLIVWLCVQGGAPCLPLYRGEGRARN